ncbi:hypothetical protein [Croceitalea dokdonensis]|nr:hypothetical protein [Croceitalea dokdonensis]
MLNLLQINVCTIAVLGDFNPIIFQPAWMAMKGIIGEAEAEGAKVDVIHKDLVRFNIDWAEIEVTPERFHIKSSKDAFFEPSRDLVESIFNILQETPVKAFGINTTMHFRLNPDDYIAFGDFLAPRPHWIGPFNDPRLLLMEILETDRSDKKDGLYRFRVQPSDMIRPYGVSTNLNNHLNVKSNRALDMVGLLKENWQSSFDFNKDIITDLWKKFKQ